VFELNEGQHHEHLVWMTCGRVEEFYDAEIEQRQRAVAQARGFESTDHSLSLSAVCTKKNCPHRPGKSAVALRRLSRCSGPSPSGGAR
jgi:Fur family ferric uptake transcriptional regulator